MKTKAAILRGVGQDFEIAGLELDPPKAGEVLIRYVAPGHLFGSGDPFRDIPAMIELYRSGQLKLDELITSTYTLDQVNQGYQDLRDGKNIRGVIVHQAS